MINEKNTIPDSKPADAYPQSSPLKGGLLFVFGIGLLTISLSCFFFALIVLRSRGELPIDRWWIVIAWVTAFFSLVWGMISVNHGRRLMTPTLNEQLEGNQNEGTGDARPFTFDGFAPYTLYLRCFRDDSKLSATRMPELSDKNIAISFVNEEESLAHALSGIGHGLAIGKPREDHPPLGIQRLYVSDDKWEKTVEEAMLNARLVVIKAIESEDRADGLWIDLKMAAKVLKPEQLVILLPFAIAPTDSLFPKNNDAYDIFRKTMEEFLPCRLPGYYGTRLLHMNLTGFLYFEKNWNPKIVDISEMRLPFFRRRSNPTSAFLKTALKPVYDQIGAPWSPPSINPVMLLPFFLPFGFIMFILLIAVMDWLFKK